jgi:hypothetical protein
MVLDEYEKEFLRQTYSFDKHDLIEVVKTTHRGFSVMSAARLVNKRKLKRQAKGVE